MQHAIQDTLLRDSAHLANELTLPLSSARIEVQCLLQNVLNVSRAWLLAHPEQRLNQLEQTRYAELLQRRLAGEPIAYILGEREFFGLNFKVTPATLIPRPETELLVELALQRVLSTLSRPDGHPLPQAGEGLGERDGEAIAQAAKALNQLRENWLNPPEWVDWVRTPEEEKAGYPLRPVAKAGREADLKKRTLTNLYNARPAWLDNAHKALDAAVAQAYGWNDYTPEMPDEEILRRLLALNLARAQ